MDMGDLVGFLEGAASAICALLAALRGDATFREVGDWLAAPGMLLLGEFGLEARDGTLYLAAALIGWGFWVRVTRVCFFTLARPFGLAGPWQYAFFLDLWLPYQKPLQKWLRLCSWVRQQRFGEGPRQYWAGFWHTIAFPFRTGGTPLGRLAFGQRLGLHMTIGLPGDGDKHIGCISYSGGGKTNWLKTWIGCLGRLQGAFIFDTDGTIAGQFALALERDGHRVIKIDPDKLDERFPCATWNMMREISAAAIRHGNAAVAGFVTNLQNALIVPDSKTQPVFVNQARLMVGALITFVWLVEQDKSMRRVRQLLTRGLPEKRKSEKEDPYARLIFEMEALGSPRADGTRFDDGAGGALCEIVRNAAGLMRSNPSDTENATPDNFRKTAIYQTAWMDDAAISPVINGPGDVIGEELKLKAGMVVFMCATMTDTQNRMAPLVRAFTMMTLYAFQRTEPDMVLRHPTVFFLDEFPNLGKLDGIATAAPGFRRFGARLVIISQSLGLLRETYAPDDYLKFINQAEAVLWMGIAPTDKDTAGYLSQTVLGECLRKEKVDGHRWPVRLLARLVGIRLPRIRFQRVPRLLMTPQQCASFLDRDTGQVIVTREGKPPLRLQRLVYFRDLPVWSFGKVRGHRESWPRALSRLVVESARGKGRVAE